MNCAQRESDDKSLHMAKDILEIFASCLKSFLTFYGVTLHIKFGLSLQSWFMLTSFNHTKLNPYLFFVRLFMHFLSYPIGYFQKP